MAQTEQSETLDKTSNMRLPCELLDELVLIRRHAVGVLAAIDKVIKDVTKTV